MISLLKYNSFRLIPIIILAMIGGCAKMPSRKQAVSGKEMILLQCKTIEKELGCRLALSYVNLQKGYKIQYREEEVFHAASLMKVPVMIELFHQIHQGKFKLDDSLRVHKDFISIASGSTFQCDGYQEMETLVGKETTIRRLAELMIQVSDNLATNLLIEKIDARNVTKTIKSMGTRQTLVLRGVMDIDAFDKGLNNVTSARDMTLLMSEIAKGKAVSPSACNEMFLILSGQKHRSMIPFYLPQEVQIANKTGSIENILHDSAIIKIGNKGYCLTILTDELGDMKTGREEIARLSNLIFNLHQSNKIHSRSN